jgi:hypothetical protein
MSQMTSDLGSGEKMVDKACFFPLLHEWILYTSPVSEKHNKTTSRHFSTTKKQENSTIHGAFNFQFYIAPLIFIFFTILN